MDTQGNFYLGRIFDPKAGKPTAEALLYDPADLTTHAVVVGMTGSGKTGLCVDLMEEAGLNQIPALMIDPKGDITNLLLHFPDLSPQDFQPWVNADQARREGKTLEQAAADAAQTWRDGLAQWEIEPERIQKLKATIQYTIFTPGSDSGVPVSILASLKAPEVPWEGNQETLREQISGTVTAILGLVGMQDVDPVRSREHILLANIFESAWSQGRDLDLGELILQTQNPPFSKLGVFDVNTFFPEKDRFSLAMLLNNILAAPAFQVWLEGQPLDIPSLLYTPEGKPRHSIFYIAHLADSERMFFVTLLFSAVEAWMRSQPGTTTLRSLLYFDEIFGYLPPTQNPPSKQPMLRMLKQARAFGVGLVLVTQNPVDLDYKGLSNTGSWFIGKLQTDQDKQRLLDGLQGASPTIDRQTYDKMLSNLGKRVFLLHNVHEKGPQLFQTRFAMSYLPGPLTRAQLPALNQLAGAGEMPTKAEAETSAPADTVQVQPPAGSAKPVTAAALVGASPQSVSSSATRPAVPGGFAEYFLPNTLTLPEAFQAAGRQTPAESFSQGLIYKPALLAQASVRFFDRRYDLDYELLHTVLATSADRRGTVRWEEVLAEAIDPSQLAHAPDPQARYAPLEAPLSDAKALAAMQKDFAEWAYRESKVAIRANETLKIYVGPQVSQADFREQCSQAARQGRDAEVEKVSEGFDKKIAAIEEKMGREERELKQDEAELSQRKMDEIGTAAETIFSLFGKRRRSVSRSLTKRRMTSQAGADVQESKEAIAEYKRQIAELEGEKEKAVQEVNDRWTEIVNQVSEIPVAAAKKDVLVDLFGVAWLPCYQVQAESELIELPGFGGRGNPNNL